MRRDVIGLVSALMLPVAAHAQDASRAPPPSPRQTFNLNPGWKTHGGDLPGAQAPGFDDRAWTDATLPHAFNEREAFARDIKALSTDITWYRKTVTLPAAATVLLAFEGARQAAEVWVNGQPVMLAENGATAFDADISKVVRPGADVIAVRIDSSWKYRECTTGSGFQWNNDNFNVNYGGLTKNVRLHVACTTYQTLPLLTGLGTTGQYVWADRIDIARRTATLHAESEVRNTAPTPRLIALRAEVRDRSGKVVGRMDGGTVTLAPGETRTLTDSARVADLNFWCGAMAISTPSPPA